MTFLVHPETLESMAFREALSLASDLNVHRVQAVTDCLATINHLKNPYRGSSTMIIEEIKAKVEEFDAVQANHELREKNWEAHDLAKASVTLSVGRHVWLLETPDIVCVPLFISTE